MADDYINIEVKAQNADNVLKVMLSMDSAIVKMIEDTLALGKTMAGAFGKSGKGAEEAASKLSSLDKVFQQNITKLRNFSEEGVESFRDMVYAIDEYQQEVKEANDIGLLDDPSFMAGLAALKKELDATTEAFKEINAPIKTVKENIESTGTSIDSTAAKLHNLINVSKGMQRYVTATGSTMSVMGSSGSSSSTTVGDAIYQMYTYRSEASKRTSELYKQEEIASNRVVASVKDGTAEIEKKISAEKKYSAAYDAAYKEAYENEANLARLAQMSANKKEQFFLQKARDESAAYAEEERRANKKEQFFLQKARDESAAYAEEERRANARNGSLDKTSQYLKLIWTYYKLMAGVQLVQIGVSSLEKYADTLTNINNQLKVAVAEGTNLTAINNDIYKLAQETRSGYEATAKLYTRMTLSNDTLKMSQQDILKLTKAINQSFAVGGNTAGEAASATLQMSQALSKGIVNGDELRSILENNSIIAGILSRELGVSRGELIKMGAEGKITADILANAILKNATSIDNQFKKMVPTIGQVIEQINNAALRTVGMSLQTSGLTKQISDMGMAFVKALESSKGQAFFYTLSKIGSALLTISGYLKELIIGYVAWKASIAGVTAFQKLLNYEIAIGTKTFKGFKAALATTGVGLAAIALGELVQYFASLTLEYGSNRRSAIELAAAVSGLNKNYVKQKQLVEEAAAALKGKSELELALASEKNKQLLAEYTTKMEGFIAVAKDYGKVIESQVDSQLKLYQSISSNDPFSALSSGAAAFDTTNLEDINRKIESTVNGFYLLTDAQKKFLVSAITSNDTYEVKLKTIESWLNKLNGDYLTLGKNATAVDIAKERERINNSLIETLKTLVNLRGADAEISKAVASATTAAAQIPSLWNTIVNADLGITNFFSKTVDSTKVFAKKMGTDAAKEFVDGFKEYAEKTSEISTASIEALKKIAENKAVLKQLYSQVQTAATAGDYQTTEELSRQISTLTKKTQELQYAVDTQADHTNKVREAYAAVITDTAKYGNVSDAEALAIANANVKKEEAINALKTLGAHYTDLDGKTVSNIQTVREATAAVEGLNAQYEKQKNFMEYIGNMKMSKDSIGLASTMSGYSKELDVLSTKMSNANYAPTDQDIEQYNKLKNAMQDTQHQMNMLDASDYGAGLKKNLYSLQEETANWKIKMTDAVAEIGSGMVTSFLKGEDAMESLKNSLANLSEYFIQLAIKMAVYQAAFGAFGGGAAAGTTSSGGLFGFGFHEGGVVGNDSPTFVRKYHTGGIIGSNEVPAILQRGEGVFTKGQMDAIGGMGSNTTVEVNFDPALKGQIAVEQTSVQKDKQTTALVLNVIKTNANKVNSLLSTSTRNQ